MKKGKIVNDRRNGEIPFKKWTDDEKVFFLHELLDHYNRVPALALEMLAAIKYEPEDRDSHGMIPKYPKISKEELNKIIKEKDEKSGDRIQKVMARKP